LRGPRSILWQISKERLGSRQSRAWSRSSARTKPDTYPNSYPDSVANPNACPYPGTNTCVDSCSYADSNSYPNPDSSANTYAVTDSAY